MSSQLSNSKNIVKKDGLLNTFGVSGTQIINGIIQEDYRPDLQGMNAVSIYEQMRKSDAQVFATLLAMELPIRATKWYIEAGENEKGETDEQDKEVSKFIEKNLFERMNNTWDDLVREILTMLPFGYSVFEKTYTGDGKNIWLDKMGIRKANTISKWQMDNGQPGIVQLVPGNTDDQTEISKKGNNINIPAEKLVIFSFRQEGKNYEGCSILRSAYKHRFYKDKLYKFDAVRHERQSVGIPIIYLPTNASAEDKAEAKTIVMNIRSTEQTGIVMPGPKDKGWLFEFADIRSSQSTNLFESIKHHNREISKNILAQFLELGDTQSGSRALSEDQLDLFLLSLQAVANQISDTFNKYIIPEIVDLNFDLGNRSYPKLKFKKLGNIDFSKLSNSLNTLASGGLLSPDEDLEKHLREVFELPKKLENDKNKKISDKIEKKDDIEKDEEYFELGNILNNKFIVDLQNECYTAEDLAVLKKKGFRFNEYEEKAYRPLTFAERKINLKNINSNLDKYSKILEDDLKKIGTKISEDLILQIKKAVENNDITALGTIKAKYKNELSQTITEIQKELFEIGKKTASAEMGVSVPPTKSEVKGAIRVQNDAIVEKMITDLESSGIITTTQIINKKGGDITNTIAPEVISGVREVIDNITQKTLNSLNTLSVTGALNLGRASIFERYPEKVYAMQYSAILDGKTSKRCLSLDGRIVKPGSKEFYDYSPPQHYNCRSIWVEIMQDETFKPDITGIPNSIPIMKTIDSKEELKIPILYKNSPAIVIVKKELEETKTKLEQLKKTGTYQNRQNQYKTKIEELEKSLKGQFFEYTKNILKDDGLKFAN